MGVKEWFKKPGVIFIVVLATILLIVLIVISILLPELKKHNNGRWPLHPWPPKAETSGNSNVAIVISIDGFRFDMLFRGKTPNLSAMAQNGSVAALKPQFPAHTFPNHYSLINGRIPTEHGIIGNHFYDSKNGDIFDTCNSTSYRQSKWWLSPTIWSQTSSAVVMWPGSDVEIRGKRPARWIPYDSSLKSLDRINKLLSFMDDSQLTNGNRRSSTNRLFMAYLNQLDDAEHDSGPESEDSNKALEGIDRAIGQLVQGLQRRNLSNITDLFVVSDHGSTPVPRDSLMTMERLLPGYRLHLRWWDCGAITQIIPDPKDQQSVLRRLRRLTNQGWPFRVYERGQIPRRYLPQIRRQNVRNRMAPIIVISKPGHAVHCAAYGKWADTPLPPRNSVIGMHGFSVKDEPDMLAIMVASGPHVVNQTTPPSVSNVPAYQNVDFYPLLAKLLGISTHPNNGTLKLAQDTLNSV